MTASAPGAPLRPLGFGEIFDRGVTVYVRNVATFALIALVVILPASVVQYYAAASDMKTFSQFAALLDQIQHPQRAAAALPGQAIPPWIIVLGLGIIALIPFAYAATAEALARSYRNESLDWRSCYRATLRRWAPLIGVALCGLAILFAESFGGLVALGVGMVASALLVRAAVALGIVAAIVTVVLLAFGLLAFFLCALSVVFAMFAVVVEGLGFSRSLSCGFGRIFNRREIGRATLMSLALCSVYFGFSVVAGMLALGALFYLHSAALDTFVQGIAGLLDLSFLALLTAIYYFDVRVRREGLDLQSELEHLDPLPA